MPLVLSEFYPTIPRAKAEASKRIMGFREHIYSDEQSSLGKVTAGAEYAFGTIFQSSIANVLATRLHYGHPDFVDAFWILTSGGMSKASPNINLSEDAFLGYNNLVDGNRMNGHVDFLEWHKGRETEFSAAGGFLFKVTPCGIHRLPRPWNPRRSAHQISQKGRSARRSPRVPRRSDRRGRVDDDPLA